LDKNNNKKGVTNMLNFKKLFRAGFLILLLFSNIGRPCAQENSSLSQNNFVLIKDGDSTYTPPKDGLVIKVFNKDSTIATYTYNPNEEIRVIVKFKSLPLLKARKEGLAPSLAKMDIESEHQKLRNDISAIESKLAPQTKAEISREFKTVFNGMALKATRGVISQIENLPYVERVYPDVEVKALLNESVPLIRANLVWDSLGAQGDGVKIGIIDTGIDYFHPDLTTNYISGGYDFVNDDNDPMDDNGHGTHCAGIAAANGILKGVAPHAKLMAFKVLTSDGWGYSDWIIAGIEKAVDPDGNPATDDGVNIISMSLGGAGDPDDPMSQAIDNAVEAGVICAVAAGNSGGYSTIGSPGCAREAITVGASDKNDYMAYFSSKGPSNKIYAIKPNITAPGVDINSCLLGGGYIQHSGTSMATPHVAGAAALIKQLHPDFSPEMIKSALMEGAKDLGEDCFTQGSGRIDVYKAALLKTIIIPSEISLGLDDISQPVWTFVDTLQIQNRDSLSQDYNISINHSFPSGISVSVNPNRFSLGPNSTQQLTFELSVNNSVVPNRTYSPYAYEGEIIAKSSSDTLKVPFAFIKSNMLNINFDEEPWIVYVHNRKYIYGWYGYPGTFLSILLPKDTYDINIIYPPSGGCGDSVCQEYRMFRVLKEGILVDGINTINVSKSEAQHEVNIIPTDENGDTISAGTIAQRFVHKSRGIGDRLLSDFATNYFSNISSNYLWECAVASKEFQEKVYQWNHYNDTGFTSSINYTNEPSDFKHLTYKYFVGPGIENIFPLHFIGGAGASWRTDDPPLSKPFVQEAHYMYPPYDTFYFAHNYKEVYSYRGPEFIIPNSFEDTDDTLLYISPYLIIKDSHRIEGYLYDEFSTPIFSTSSDSMKIGLSPPHWFGKFQNQNTLVQIKVVKGAFFGLFMTQMYDSKYLWGYDYNDLKYRLYQGDSLVDDGTIFDKYSWPTFSLPVDAGSYTFKTSYDKYYIGKQKGIALVIANFNTSLTDKNPPYLLGLNITSNGEPNDLLSSGNTNKIETVTEDDMSGFAVNLYYQTVGDTTWQALSLSQNDSSFKADVPDIGDGYVNLKVIAIDALGNSLIYQLNPAFRFGNPPEPPNIFQLELPMDGTSPDSLTAHTFIWNKSLDPDSGSITYTLYYGADSTFLNATIVEGLTDTTYTLSEVLLPDTTYYWKVVAKDSEEVSTRCLEIYHFRPTGFTDVPGNQDLNMPKEYSLSQNHPNPFNSETAIEYALIKDSEVSLKIYNILGQRVRTLANEHQSRGFKKIIWDGKNENGETVSSGLYFYKIEAGNFVQSKKMLLLK
jgi:hypothetical protein